MFEAFHCEFGEEALDGVEPGSGCGGEVEDEARMFLEPRHDIGMLVGGIVVDDDMDRPLLRHPDLDDVEKPDELLMAVALHALADDLAFKHIEGSEWPTPTMARGRSVFGSTLTSCPSTVSARTGSRAISAGCRPIGRLSDPRFESTEKISLTLSHTITPRSRRSTSSWAPF